MKVFIKILMILMLWETTTYSQSILTPFSEAKIVIIDQDTNFLIPNWRLQEANRKFITLDFANETIGTLECLVREWEKRSLLQEQQIVDLSSIIKNKDLEIQSLNQMIVLKEEEVGLEKDKLKYYKKQGNVLKVALGASLLGLVSISILAIAN